MRAFTSPGGQVSTIRVDISEDGEPTRSIEFFQEVYRGRKRNQIRIGNTAGESYTYTYRNRGYDLAHFISSALLKDWWAQRCPHCGSAKRGQKLMTQSWNGTKGLCVNYWHITDGSKGGESSNGSSEVQEGLDAE